MVFLVQGGDYSCILIIYTHLCKLFHHFQVHSQPYSHTQMSLLYCCIAAHKDYSDIHYDLHVDEVNKKYHYSYRLSQCCVCAYHMAGNIGGELNLGVWRLGKRLSILNPSNLNVIYVNKDMHMLCTAWDQTAKFKDRQCFRPYGMSLIILYNITEY